MKIASNVTAGAEVYAAAGIRFDFSEPYIRELIDFIVQEIEKIDRNEF